MKSIVRCVIEICLAVLIIVVSYPIWKSLNVEAYEKSIKDYNNGDTNISVDEEFGQLVYLQYADNIEETPVVFLNNYKNSKENFKLVLVLNEISEELANNLYLLAKGKTIPLNEMLMKRDNDSYYYFIKDVQLNKYEKESYDFRLLLDDDFNIDNYQSFNYNFIKEV